MQTSKVHLYGAGRVGQTLGILFRQHHYPLGQVICRHLTHAQEAVLLLGEGTPQTTFIPSSPPEPALFVLTPPDDQLPSVVQALKHLSFHPETLIFHCSGSLSSTLLEPLRLKGAHIGSIHPLKSFASPQLSAKTFHGTPCSYEGPPESLSRLKELILHWGGQAFLLQTSQKISYHSAAVVASNYLIALTQFALSLAEKAGIPPEQGLSLLFPLLEGTLQNLKEKGPQRALTGPIQRGDVQTIQKHLLHLSPEERLLYQHLGRYCLALCPHHPPPLQLELQRLLNTPHDPV